MSLGHEKIPIKSKPLTKYEQIKLILKNITVEPMMVCYILPSVMTNVVNQNLSMEKACRVSLALDPYNCDAISVRNESAYLEYKMDEENVQKLTANLVIYKSVILSVIPSIFLMFLGSWSDRKQRRKPCILLPIIAEQLACCGFILCTYFFYELPIWVNVVFEAVPQALSGGWLSIFMGVYSYVSTISTLETRTIRIGAVHMFLNISICLGLSLSGILYQHLGFYGVYSIAFVMYAIGLVYGVFFVKEVPKQHQEIVEKERNFIVEFVDLKHVRETLKVCFKTGERNRRMRVCAIMVLVVLVVGPLIGELNVSYMFARYKFDWSATDYSIFSTFQFVVHVFGMKSK